MERDVSADAGGCGDSRHPDAVPGSRLQRIRGTICPLHQRRMPRSGGDPREGAPAPDAARIHGALSPGTESSRFTGSLDRPRAGPAAGRRGPLPPETRRAASLLLSSGLMARPDFRIVRPGRPVGLLAGVPDGNHMQPTLEGLDYRWIVPGLHVVFIADPLHFLIAEFTDDERLVVLDNETAPTPVGD